MTRRRNPTTPLPVAFPPTEPALLTAKEFLDLRNPDDKMHPSSAYDASLKTLNWRDEGTLLGNGVEGRRKYLVIGKFGADEAERPNLVFKDEETGEVAAVLLDGTLYQSRFHTIPDEYRPTRPDKPYVAVRWDAVREVKYPDQYLDRALRHPVQEEYPYLLQRVTLKGEPFEVRAKEKPRADRRDTLVVLDRDKRIAASGADEWGATLLQVATEYRGKGLGRLLAKFWYDINPSSTSGGFTAAGRANALAAWEDRVRDFQARGWYTELVREARLPAARVRSILAGLTKRRGTSPIPSAPAAGPERPDLRFFVDEDNVSFVVYDARFLQDHDEKHLLGYGFFRDRPNGDTFLYRLEYAPAYRDLVTSVALQLARDNGDKVYIAAKPSDVVEWEGVPHVRKRGDYLTLTKDVFPLKDAAKLERLLRKRTDPHGEMEYLLLEGAEAKWA